MRRNRVIFDNVLIGLTQQYDKLVFEKRCHCETSAHTGRGNPPAPWNWVSITTKYRNAPVFGYYSVHFPSNRGIATPVCGLVRNDSVF